MSRRTGGGRLSVPYDTLLYAPGSTIDVTSVPGVAEHAHTVAGPESALAIAAALRDDPRARVVVVGGGSPASPQARSTTAARSTCACGRWVHCAAAIPGPWGDALAMGCRTGGFTGPWAADVVVARLRGLPARPFRFRYFHECPAAAPQRGAVGACVRCRTEIAEEIGISAAHTDSSS